MDGLVGDARPDDEPGHEVTLRPDERADLGADPDARRAHGRGMLDLSADAEQVRVIASEANHPAIRGPGGVDEEIAIRDPTGQRPQGQFAAGNLGDALQRADELVPELATEHIAHGRVAGGVAVTSISNMRRRRADLSSRRQSWLGFRSADRCLAVAKSASTSAARPRTDTA